MAKNEATLFDEYTDEINKETIYLDVELPEITTTMSQTNDGYTVVPYDDGSGLFEIKDRLSGTNGLKGSFIWNKGESSLYSSRYYYAVTSSADVPADSDWILGYIGVSNSFYQVEGMQYLHIKKDSEETYEMQDTTLSFTASDYAGNKYSLSNPVTFRINAVWDNILPVVSLGTVSRNLTDKG